MKVLLINDHLKIVSGAEKLAYAIKSALEKRGHKVELFGSEEGENFASYFSRWYSLKWYKKTTQKIKEFKPDVVHILNCVRVISPSVVRAALNSKVPVVFDQQDLSLFCPRLGGVYDKNRPKKNILRHRCFLDNCLGYDEKIMDFPRNILKISKLILHRRIINDKGMLFVSNSRFLAKALEKSFGLKSEIVHHGVEIPKKITDYKKDVLFIGQLSEEKGLHTVAGILNEIKRYRVLILGRGILKESLENNYKNLKFLGFQKPEQYYKKASIAVMPAIWLDTFPLTVLETMAYGICVVASRIGGIPEQVEHMKTGLLFEPGSKKDFEEKLNYLIKNPSEIKRMGKNARKFIKSYFSWSKISKDYENVYLKAIKRAIS